MANDAAVAVDIGGTTTKVALVAQDAVSAVSSLPTAAPAEFFLDRVSDAVAKLPAGAIGISVAGFVNDSATEMIYNPNLPWLENVPLRSEFASRTGRDVTAFDADSNAAAYAEYAAGVGRGSKRLLCLSIGTGVGGGMIVDGSIVRLAYGGLGDIGHVIVDPTGPTCTAGCRGCAEATISAPAIETRWDASATDMIRRGAAGDQRAKEILAETGRLLGVALATYAAILFPDTIAIGGGLSEAGDLLLKPARLWLESLAGPFYRRDLQVRKARFGWQAPLVGAGLMALRPCTSRH